MKKSFFLLSILAAISLVAAEAPSHDAGINNGFVDQVPGGFEGAKFAENFAAPIQGEKFQFQTEVSRLMNIVINSLYKTPEIFLRELISNGSDALDKIRFQSLTNPDAMAHNPNLNVTIAVNPYNRIITITDTGIGMTKSDLQKNLGTIAKSGTSDFIEAMDGENSAEMDLIGKFGVGFYSVFLVADKVRVTSKNNNDDQYIWESTAVNDFSIAKDPAGNTLGRGTQIAIHLKEDQDQYLDPKRIEGLITKYSEFITFPIYLRRQKTKEIDAPSKDPEGSVDDVEEGDSDEAKVETEEENKAAETKPEKITVTYEEDDLMNSVKPIWLRDPKSITHEEYDQFYSVLTKDPNASPMAFSHFKAEGEVEFKSIIYIPEKAPKDLFSKLDTVRTNVKLYVKRVFITDESPDFLPKWLSFLRVVVDAEDAPLNVSRETVQSNKSVKAIHKHLVKKTFDLLKSLSENEEKYKDFIAEYGMSLKLGAMEDKSNGKKISKLLRYKSSNAANGGLTSLADYVKRMKKGQKDIYYFTGTSADEIRQSPFVESLLARGYEVLFMEDTVDEILLSHLKNFEGHAFQNVAKSTLKLGDEDEDADKFKELQEQFKPLATWIEKTLKNDIEKVQISKRLTTSPAALVANEYGWTANMEKLMEGQAKQAKDEAMHSFFKNQRKILEINPGHPLILGMLERANKDPEAYETDVHFQEMAQILYELTLVRSGYNLKDGVKAFAGRVENMLRVNLGVDTSAEAVFKAPVVEEKSAEEIEADQKEMEEKLAKEEAQAEEDAKMLAEGGMTVEELNAKMQEITGGIGAGKKRTRMPHGMQGDDTMIDINKFADDLIAKQEAEEKLLKEQKEALNAESLDEEEEVVVEEKIVKDEL